MYKYPSQQNRSGAMGISMQQDSALARLLLILPIVVGLGFPGGFMDVLPGFISPLFEYGSFLGELLIMLLFSGDTFGDIKLINLKSRYSMIYALCLEFFIVSMLITAHPTEEFISCFRFATTALYALFLVDRYGEIGILEMSYYAQIVFLVATLLFFMLYPNLCFSYEDGGQPSFSGLFPRKNGCAAELCFGITIQTVLYFVRKNNRQKVSRFFLVILSLQLIMLVACRSVGALLSAGTPFLFLWIWQNRLQDRRRIDLGLMYIVVSVGFLIFALTILPLFAPLFEALGKDATLSNRTTMWVEHIGLMTETHTFTGFGFNMFWRDENAIRLFHRRFAEYSWFTTMTTGAHNVLLELWLNVGLLGLGFYFLNMLHAFRNPRSMTKDQYTICSGILVLFMISGLVERAYTPSDYQSMYLFVIWAIGCRRDTDISSIHTGVGRGSSWKAQTEKTTIQSLR